MLVEVLPHIALGVSGLALSGVAASRVYDILRDMRAMEAARQHLAELQAAYRDVQVVQADIERSCTISEAETRLSQMRLRVQDAGNGTPRLRMAGGKP